MGILVARGSAWLTADAILDTKIKTTQQSKQLCQLAPSFQSHHSFHHGSAGSPSHHHLDFQRQAGVSPTGRSFGSSKNGGRRPKSQRDLDNKYERRRKYLNR